MKRTSTILTVLLLAALPLAGCIENMGDLKDRLDSASTTPKTPVDTTNTTVPDTTPASAANETVTNETPKELKPPVARITIFGPGGALAYRASFVAENQTDPVFVKGGVITFIAADSEAVEDGTVLENFEWTINGHAMTGRKVEMPVEDAGKHAVSLKVTDTAGSTDMQSVAFAIAPVPFTETVEITGGPVFGVLGEGVADTQTWTVLAEKDGKKLKVENMHVVEHHEASLDSILTVTDPEGTSTEIDTGTASESFSTSGAAAGEWSATVSSYAGGAPEYTLVVTITYVEIVEGLGDGHAHAH